MGKKQKVFLFLGLFSLMGIAALAGLAFHYYTNPSKIKHLAEDALSVFTGAECSIQGISYDQEIRTVRLEGLQLIESMEGYVLEIPEMAAVISVQGRVGRRTLVLENLQANGFTLKAPETWALPRFAGDREEVSLFRRILSSLFSFLVFKDVRVYEAALIDGRVTGRWGEYIVNLEGIRATVSRDRFLEAGFALGIRNPVDGLDLSFPLVKWSTDQPLYPLGPTMRARLEGEEIALESPWVRLSRAVLDASMVYSRKERTLAMESFTIASDDVTIHAGDGGLRAVIPFLAEVKAVLDWREKSLSAPAVRIALGDIGELQAKFEADLSGSQGLTIEVVDLRMASEKLIAALPPSTRQGLGNLALSGPIHVGGRVAGMPDRPLGTWSCEFRAGLKDNFLSWSTPGTLLTTDLTGEAQVRGTLSDPDILLNLKAGAFQAHLGNMKVEKGSLGVSLTGAYPLFRLNELSLDTDAAALTFESREFLLQEVRARTRSGSVDLRRKSLALSELSLQTSTLKNLSLSVEIDEKALSVDLKGEETHLFEFCQGLGFLPRGWNIQASDSLQARLLLDRLGFLKVLATLRVRNLSFESEDGAIVGENLSFVLEPAFDGYVEPRGKLTGAVSMSAEAGEILCDRFYLDLGKHPVATAGKGTYEPGTGSVDLSELRLQVEELVTLNLQGTWAGEKPQASRFTARVPLAPLGPVFRQFLVEPYRHQNPFLAELHLAGLFSLELEVSGENGLWTVAGRSLWQEGQARTAGEGMVLQGIELDLPIWYRHGIKGAGGKAPVGMMPLEREGSVFIDSVQLPLLPPQPMGTRLKAGPDGLHTLSPIPIRTGGGQIEIGRMSFREPFSGNPNIATSLTLKDLDLKPWLSRIWPNPVEGILTGQLDPVEWREEVLSAKGQVRADLFGGHVILSNMGAKRFPSLTPVIAFDAGWADLDLAQITDDTAFGKIQGTLRGHAQGFEMADGQPQAFDLFMETVKRGDTPQRISVQAVDNIARIGGGASPFSGLAGAFVSFFRDLPYEKIGIRAVLENDVFRINGTILENNREYLIKKGGFSGVDVIIGSPGSNTISFKDMVRRIKRVTDSEEGPVIE